MKKESGFIVTIIENTVAFCLASVWVLIVMVALKVLLPVLRFCAKATANAARRVLAKLRAKKVAVAPRELPTPDIFKGASNLAPAKQIRY